MLKLCAKIEIKGEKTWVFEKITACEIVRDSDALTTTCKLTLPKKVKWKDETSNPIKRGDKITVWLGYDDNLQLAFTGYVLRVGLKAPVEVFCEDEMFMLKQSVMDYSLIVNPVDLRSLLKNFTDFPVYASDKIIVDYSFRSSAVSVANFLDFFKSFGPDKFFFRNVKGKYALVSLHSFVPNLEDIVDHYIFESGRNIISDRNLDVFRPGASDVYIRISVPASQNSKRQFVERGSADKAFKKFIFRKWCYNLDVANRIADYIVQRETQSGLSGRFLTFGHQLVWPFDVVGIKIDGERKGKYQVSKNTITYGSSGFRQDITLGARVLE